MNHGSIRYNYKAIIEIMGEAIGYQKEVTPTGKLYL
jgi:hypothetical protein